MKTDLVATEASGRESAVKTVYYRRCGADGASGRVSVRTLRDMISRWEIRPDDLIRIDGDLVERRVREYPALSPLDEMLHDAAAKVVRIKQEGRTRAGVIRELEMLREYAESSDRVYSVTSFLLGWLRYAENAALARGLFLKAIERGYPFTSIARNNLAVAQIRLGDPAGRDNLILAANDPHRTPVALLNLARLLQHLQGLGESTGEIASVKDLQRVARAEWRKAPPSPGEPASYALFLCEGDIPASFASEARTLARVQGQIEDILAEGEDCLRQGRLEQATAHAARASAEIDRAREELSGGPQRQPASPIRFLSVRLSRLEKAAAAARDARNRQGLLDTFRKRLCALEESLKLKVPPADLIQQAEILLDSARTEGERAEAGRILRECQGRVARHLLDTANELLSTGEKDVAVGLFRRALGMETDISDEVKLRLASVRRDELEKEISLSIQTGAFEEARVKVARLRSIHPIFEPLAKRLEAEVNAAEAGALLDRVVLACGVKVPDRDAVLESRRWITMARELHPDPAILRPIELHVAALAAKLGMPPLESEGAAAPLAAARQAPVTGGGAPTFVIEPGGKETPST